MISPGRNGFLYRKSPAVTISRFLLYQSSSIFSRLIEPVDVFLILSGVMISLPTLLDCPRMTSIVATPFTGGTNFAGAAGAGVCGWAAGLAWAKTVETVTAQKSSATAGANTERCIATSRRASGCSDYRLLHLAVPVLRFRVRRAEDFQVPLAAAPGLDDLSRDDVDEDLGKRAPFGIALEMVGGLVPREARIEHHRQKEVVAVVDDDELTTGAF